MSPADEVGRYKVLLDTARCFGRAMNLNSLIDEILRRSQEVMRAEACTLLLPDPPTGELIIHAIDARVAALSEPLRVPRGKGLAGAVFESKQTLNIKDAQQDPRHYPEVSKRVGFVTHAIISIPLLEGDECRGVLQALNPRDREYFDVQDEEIFEGFGGLIVNALLRLEAQRLEIERERSCQELLLAREIQDSFLPLGAQKFPFCRVYSNYLPAHVVGGDFYFVHPIGETRLLLGLGDVTGKGIPAALTMARATAMITAMVEQLGGELGEWVTVLNRRLSQDLKAGRFLGLTFLLADAASSTLQICAAGQFPPFHFDGERWTNFFMQTQLPLGILAAHNYRAEQTSLKPGNLWLSFSDGITEARNSNGEEFTLERFLRELPAGKSGTNIVADAVQDWRNFVGAAPQHDDASLLLLDWRGLPPASDLTTSCCLENLRMGREFVEQWAVYAGYDDVTAGRIVMACDEAASNVFKHGYDQKPGPLSYHAEVSDDNFTIQIIDEAKPVDASKIKGRELSELRPGGLGTYIMGQVFDEVKYEPAGKGTVLTLSKHLP
jgi:phosphoserine phosphatase RsbU/P